MVSFGFLFLFFTLSHLADLGTTAGGGWVTNHSRKLIHVEKNPGFVSLADNTTSCIGTPEGQRRMGALKLVLLSQVVLVAWGP